MRELFAEVAGRRASLALALEQAAREHAESSRLLNKVHGSFLARYEKGFLAEITRHVEAVAKIQSAIESELDGCVVDVGFGTGSAAAHEFTKVASAFDVLARAAMVWDVKGSVERDRAAARSLASHLVSREDVTFGRAAEDIFAAAVPRLRFGNANGGTIILTPAFVLVREGPALDVIDVRDLSLTGIATKFIEEGAIPADAQVVGETWERVNKDGSPDRRFKGNRSIPLVLYGDLQLTTTGGLNERYLVSDAKATTEFAAAFVAYQSGLPRGGENADDSGQGAGGDDDDLALPDLELPPLPARPQRPLGPRAVCAGIGVVVMMTWSFVFGTLRPIPPASSPTTSEVVREAPTMATVVRDAQRPTQLGQATAEASRRPDSPSRRLARAELAEAQRLLISLGYDPGSADGVVGPRTRAAANKFRVSVGLPVTKEMDLQLLSALRQSRPQSSK